MHVHTVGSKTSNVCHQAKPAMPEISTVAAQLTLKYSVQLATSDSCFDSRLEYCCSLRIAHCMLLARIATFYITSTLQHHTEQ